MSRSSIAYDHAKWAPRQWGIKLGLEARNREELLDELEETARAVPMESLTIGDITAIISLLYRIIDARPEQVIPERPSLRVVR